MTYASSHRLLRERGICVVIPTSGNVATIRDVVERTLACCLDVIVVADGPTDGTLDVLLSIEGITVVPLAKTSGKGAALKQGFRKAIDMGFAYAITLDADGQHFPEDIPTLLHANQKHPGALIVGRRKGLDKAERSFGSKFANAFSNFWFAVQTGHYLKDTQTGFRLYPLRKLRGLSLLTARFEAELELLVFASWHGIEIVSVPVNVFYPKPEERVSYFRPVPDFTRIFVLNTVLCLLAVIYGLPLAIGRWLLTAARSLYSLLFFLLFVLLIAPPYTLYCILIAKGFPDDGEGKEKEREGLHRMLCFFARLVTLWHGIPGVKFSLSNPRGEDFSRPAIIISNHQSHLDLMTVLMLTPKLVCLTKDWVWRNPLYGYIIRRAEFYPVTEGTEALMPKLQSLVDRGYSIVVYPEGTRSPDCTVKRFRQGAFYLAQQLHIDILPIVLYGTGKALPKKGKYLRKWPVRMEIDERISPEAMLALSATPKEQASKMREYYKRRYAELSNRIEQDV